MIDSKQAEHTPPVLFIAKFCRWLDRKLDESLLVLLITFIAVLALVIGVLMGVAALTILAVNTLVGHTAVVLTWRTALAGAYLLWLITFVTRVSLGLSQQKPKGVARG